MQNTPRRSAAQKRLCTLYRKLKSYGLIGAKNAIQKSPRPKARA